MRILYIIHYGYTPKEFYCDPISNRPKKIIGDGGSNIHIHLIQYFKKKDTEICISTFFNNFQYQAFFKKSSNIKFDYFWTPQQLFKKNIMVLENIYKIFFLPIKILFSKNNYDIVVSTTDFLPDVLYSFLIKLKNPKIKWVASYFLDAPKPWARNNPYKVNITRFFIGLIYWFVQRFSKYFIKLKADIILVTSEPDVQQFITKKRHINNIIVVQGGVDISHAIDYLKSKKVVPFEEKKYDACFLGRLHYQKGILEMVDIWKNVCRKKPLSKLAIIGNGPLELELREKIIINSLSSNIDILGFLTGRNKFEIFKQSKIILHPAIYDSGGMSAAEAMTWGMPGVCFDLESLKTYYPKGMIKTECFNIKKFADNILLLLDNKELYAKLSKESLDLIIKNWDWNKKASLIYDKII